MSCRVGAGIRGDDIACEKLAKGRGVMYNGIAVRIVADAPPDAPPYPRKNANPFQVRKQQQQLAVCEVDD